MSEPQTETPVVPETPEEEPVSPPETPEENPDEEPAEPIEGPDEPAAPPEPPQEGEPPQSRALTPKERKQRDEKLDREKERHASRVGEIMGDEAVDLIPCPVCMDGIDGWVFIPEVQQLPAEAIARIRQVIGLPDYSTFRPASFAQTCPACDGLGEVLTGSHVPGREVTTCETCKKSGWIRVGAPPTNGHVPEEAAQVITGPTVFVDEEADVEVRNLRHRGYTVIPPMQPVPGT